jgi:hypothetical protein
MIWRNNCQPRSLQRETVPVRKRMPPRKGKEGRQIGKIVSAPLGHPPSSSANPRGNAPPDFAAHAAERGTRAKEAGTTEGDRERPELFDTPRSMEPTRAIWYLRGSR